MISDLPEWDDHEGVHFLSDAASGLRAIVAVHSTHLGPGGGGTRLWTYPDETAAVRDALRLSRAMSYKNAMAGLEPLHGFGIGPGDGTGAALALNTLKAACAGFATL